MLDLVKGHLYSSAEIGSFKVDDEKISRIYDEVLRQGLIFVSCHNDEVVGTFGGIVFEPIYNDEKIFQEMFFAFKPEHAAKAGFLVRHIQKHIKCDGMLIVHMAGAERLAKLYNRLGFDELERQYLWKRNK